MMGVREIKDCSPDKVTLSWAVKCGQSSGWTCEKEKTRMSWFLGASSTTLRILDSEPLVSLL